MWGEPDVSEILLLHRGQRHGQQGGVIDVIDADDAHIAWNPQAGGQQAEDFAFMNALLNNELVAFTAAQDPCKVREVRC